VDKMDGMSMDVVGNNIEKIKELFPNAVTEEKIDFDMLRTMLGDEVEVSKEKYQFTWNGKAESIKLAQSPSSATLRPCKEKSKDWDTTENLYIEGDNLEVLKQLQKTYFGKIKIIYIDPPYNTGHDFVYKDDFKDSIDNYKEQTAQVSSSNPETNGRFHSDWLNMMYPRLILARNLLSDNGMIFISINDKELQNLKKLCEEVFGSTNEVATLIWDKNHSAQAGIYKVYHEYVLVYARDITKIKKSNALNNELFEAGAMKKVSGRHPASDFTFPAGTRFDAPNGTILEDEYGDTEKVIITKGRMISDNGCLKEDVTLRAGFTQANQMREFFYGDRENLVDSQGQKVVEFYFNSTGKIKIVKERGIETPQTTCKFGTQGAASTALAEVFGLTESPFSSPKPVQMIRDFVARFSSKDDIILDFFSGSATTAHSVMEFCSDTDTRRKYILVQLPEDLIEARKGAQKDAVRTLDVAIDFLRSINKELNLCNLGEERIRRAGEKIKMEWLTKRDEQGLLGKQKPFSIDIGFKVFRLDSTNINPWDNAKEQDEQTIFDTATVFKLDRSKEDILYEIMLKYGLFDQPTSEIELNGKTMYRVGQRHMVVCLEDQIDDSDITEICKLDPRVVVFKEDGFKNDNAKINAEYNLKKSGVEDVKCI